MLVDLYRKVIRDDVPNKINKINKINKKTMKQDSIIRTIYLYIFALLGLVLLIIGGVRFLDMGLKAFIFTKADEEQKLNYYFSEPYIPVPIEKMEKLQEGEELSEEQKETLKQWLADYQEQKEKREEFDPLVSRRHRDASMNLAMILIGLPLYLYHWGIIKKETRKEKE